ncbi:CopG family ribbon-helix-helix protein [Rhizobium helianthi]|uniref:CopG family ribbon-helix-helix protein n=2 Tax=Bacteria TaxID=2 RepID=A0ABW4M5C2_9HYPH
MPKTQSSDSVTLRVPAEILAQVEAIAEATDRSRSYIIVRALRTYLMNEGGDILSAIKGKQQIDAGETEDMDAVIAEMDRIIAGKVA